MFNQITNYAKKPLFLLGALLLVLTIFSLVVTLCADSGSIIRDFGMNITTELGGITITLIVVDRVIKWQEEQREQKIVTIAFKRVSSALAIHVDLWASLSKACMPSRSEHLPTEFRQLLVRQNIANIGRFNVSAPAATYPPSLWNQYLVSKIVQFQRDLEVVIDKYAVFLSPDQIELLEKCASSDFCKWFPTLLSNSGISGTAIFIAQVEGGEPQVNPMLLEHLHAVNALVDHTASVLNDDRIGKISGSTWSDTVGPKFASARLTT